MTIVASLRPIEPEAGAQERARGLFFRRAAGITRTNVAVYFGGAFLGLMLVSLYSSLSPSVLTHLAGIPLGEQGRRQGSLVLYNELVLLPAVFLAGVLSDRIGRRSVYAAAFLASALVFLFVSRVDSWTMLIGASMAIAIGQAGQQSMMSTVVADYAHPEDRGRAIAGMGIVVGLGAMLGALLLSRMPRWFEAAGYPSRQALQGAFLVAAGLAASAALLMRLGLSARRPTTHVHEKPVTALAREAVHSAREPKVLLAYCAGFVSRCDMVVLAFLTLWVNKAAVASGMTPSDAAAKAGMMFGIAQSAAWVTGAFIAILFDRREPAVALAVSLAIAAAGYTSVCLVDDPLSGSMIAGASAIGVGQIAALLGSQAYVAKVAPAQARGSVIGGFGFCGAVGTLLAGIAGGSMFDRHGESAPFVAVGLLSLTLSAFAFALHRKKLA